MEIKDCCKKQIGKANAIALAATLSLSIMTGGLVSHLLDLSETQGMRERKTGLESCVDGVTKERKRALLVLQDNERWDDIVLMRQLLSERGYCVQALYPEDIDEKTLVSSIREFAKNTDEKSKNIFYFSGHGTFVKTDNGSIVRGIQLNQGEREEERIMPAYALLEELANIKGYTGVVIDSCFSGQFSELAKDAEVRTYLGLKNFVILASCPFDKKGIKDDYEIEGKKMRLGSLTTGLVCALMASRGKEFNLSTEQILCGNEDQRANPEKYSENTDEELDISFELQRTGDCDFKL